ncbi:hypothetical protein ACE1BH_24235 [Aeromonas jandaei]
MSSRNSPAIDKAPGSRSLSFYRRLALLFALLATSSSTLALSLQDLDPAFERCEALKSQHSATLPAKSDPFWSLKREQRKRR